MAGNRVQVSVQNAFGVCLHGHSGRDLPRSSAKNQEEQIGRSCPGAVLVEDYYSPCAAATGRSSRRSGLIEKNLCRQGSHRKAGSPRILPRIAVPPGTRAAEMRRNARLPQIPQWA